MIATKGYAAHSKTDPLNPWDFKRREPGDDDVLIDILYCGICHSDIHQVRSEWGRATYPIVPGHEIVGRIAAVGKNISGFKVGDTAGIGCMVNSCQYCDSCHNG
ncbi:alcohol dehydrogenase catalytic domain-containing protein [Niabella ginsenosidivorans]|uniref:alcohol dehydrogenase catalytic domain-containing protein n=1 Tax=Niabella ginsenosidivorans TaxID=1176587 RepID=UPI000AF7BCEE|nr:alcohol dehydrogenase catalytic domain-containing protein [Niabella ginsenosidivorans]